MAITKYVYVTPAGAGVKDGTTIANAMGVGEYQTYKNGAIVAGDVPVIFDGAYTMTANIDSSARDGTAASPICEIGVKAGTTNEPPLYSDWSRTAADRPVITAAAYTFTHGDYERFHNIEVSITSSEGWKCGAYNTIENCKATNASASAGRFGIQGGTSLSLINSEVSCTNGNGVLLSTYCQALFNYMHDSNYGIFMTTRSAVIGNVVDTCTTANIHQATGYGSLFLNNTCYAGAKGIAESGTGYGSVYINNILEGQTTSGISQVTQRDYNIYMNNHGSDARCTDMWVNVDITGVFKDQSVTEGDPLFSNPASGLFDLGIGSGCKDTGLANTLIAAASTINKGAWQNPVGGGSLNQVGFNGGMNG